jgi:hypothetical protein
LNVVDWLGNSAREATAHYQTQTADQDFEKASGRGAESGAGNGKLVRNPVQNALAINRTSAPESRKTPMETGVLLDDASGRDSRKKRLLTLTGFEPVSRP